jgi:hypothetical protein
MWKSTSIPILRKFNFEVLTDLYVHRRYLRENDGTGTRGRNTECKFSRKCLYGSHEFHCCSKFINQQWSTEQQSVSFPRSVVNYLRVQYFSLQSKYECLMCRLHLFVSLSVCLTALEPLDRIPCNSICENFRRNCRAIPTYSRTYWFIVKYYHNGIFFISQRPSVDHAQMRYGGPSLICISLFMI